MPRDTNGGTSALQLEEKFEPIVASLRSSFSHDLVSDEDGTRFSQASLMLLHAAWILFFASWLGGIVADSSDVERVLPLLQTYSKPLFFLALSFFVAALLPRFLYRIGRLHYRTGTISHSMAFALLTISIGALVSKTGGLGSSIFGAMFLSLFGISLIVPKSKALRLILFLFIFIVGGVIVYLSFPNEKKFHHDLAILLLALIANFAALL